MGAAAKIAIETRRALLAGAHVRLPVLTLVPPAPAPKPRLRCRWEYNAEEKRIVQIWELRP